VHPYFRWGTRQSRQTSEPSNRERCTEFQMDTKRRCNCALSSSDWQFASVGRREGQTAEPCPPLLRGKKRRVWRRWWRVGRPVKPRVIRNGSPCGPHSWRLPFFLGWRKILLFRCNRQFQSHAVYRRPYFFQTQKTFAAIRARELPHFRTRGLTRSGTFGSQPWNRNWRRLDPGRKEGGRTMQAGLLPGGKRKEGSTLPRRASN